MKPNISAYAAIGQAVCAFQEFEAVFLFSFELFRMVLEPEYRELTQGIISPKKFRVPIKILIKHLADRNEIAPDLAEQIEELLEDRHTVIHRWAQQKGFASPEDEEYWRQYESLAKKVDAESKRISRLLLSYMLKWAEPEWAQSNRNEYIDRISQLFHSLGSSEEGKG